MKLINTNRFFLKGTSERFLHLATVQDSVREFMCFFDRFACKTYIEEVTGGSLNFISDDSLAEAIAKFLEDNKVLEMSKPTIPDKQWYKKNE